MEQILADFWRETLGSGAHKFASKSPWNDEFSPWGSVDPVGLD
jgi:hypothetical protein